jgi:hypothetical protein
MAAPSGIVNGSGLYGETALRENPAAAIIVPTVLQMAADALDSLTHITCLYNKYWYSREDMMTLPICFFYVTKMQEAMASQTSEQRLILYEPQNQASLTVKDFADQVRPGAMQTIIDNSVRQPKTYQMDIVLPFMPVSRQYLRSVNEIQQVIGSFIEVFGGDSTVYDNIFASVNAILKTAQQLGTIVTKLPMTDDAQFLNKNSLEAMFDSQKVLCMKMWSGYQYKYVLITGCTIDKQPREDDVFRATLQLKELPILTITPPKDAANPAHSKRNWAATAVRAAHEALIYPAMSLTRVSKEDVAGKLVNMTDSVLP